MLVARCVFEMSINMNDYLLREIMKIRKHGANAGCRSTSF